MMLFLRSAAICVSLFVVVGTQAQSVDPLTGRLQMSVPLGKLEANDISVGISINHKGAGLRVAEGESDCGMGWSLQAGGEIARIVRGLPDEINTATKKGWLYNNNAATVNSFVPVSTNSNNSAEPADWNFLEGLIGNSYVNDTEPDIFIISAPGLFAKFIFGTDQLPKLLNYQDIQIIPNLPSGFFVKTNNGLVYTFEIGNSFSRRARKNGNPVGIEGHTDWKYYNLPNSQDFISITSSWNLVSMTSTKTGTTANFSYLPTYSEGEGRIYHSVDSSFYLHDMYNSTRLQSITLNSFAATFFWNSNLLQSLKLEELSTLDKKEIHFEYAATASVSGVRYKYFLKRLLIRDDPCKPQEAFEFEYKDVNTSNHVWSVPNHVNWARLNGKDFFGYPTPLNDITKKDIPTLYFYAAMFGTTRLSVTPISGNSANDVIYGQNRMPGSSNSFGALTKIVVPTGGVTKIEYEPNTYFDASLNLQLGGDGARVKKITTNGGEEAFGKGVTNLSAYREIVKEYEYVDATNTQTSGLILSPIKLGFIIPTALRACANNLGEEPMVLYSRVKEKIPGRGATVYEFNLPGVYPETANGEWKASMSLVVKDPSKTIFDGNARKGYYEYPYPPSTNYDFRRGTISKYSVYNESNQLVSEKTTTYTTLTKNPLAIKGLKFERNGDVYQFGMYEILTGRADVVSQEVVKEVSEMDATKLLVTTTNWAYNAQNLLASVTASLPNGTTTLKTYKYAHDFPFTLPASTDTAAMALKYLNNNNRGTELVEEVSYLTLPGAAQTVTDASLVTYRDFGNGIIMPYKIFMLPPGAVFTPAAMNGQLFVPDADYLLKQTIKEYDDQARPLTQLDDKRNYVASHYAKASYTMATLANATAQQAIVENFEGTCSFGLSANDSGIYGYSAGWTGQKAIVLKGDGSTTQLTSSPLKLIQKNGNRYRVSCWVYGLQNKTITIVAKSGTASVTSLTFTNPTSNKWNYLEGEMNMSAVPATFTLEVTANASLTDAVTIDDFVFVPSTARIALQTILPFKGTTSATDDRGNSTANKYDGMGRLVGKYDRARNLVQKNEYMVRDSKNAAYCHIISDKEIYLLNVNYLFTPYTFASCYPITSYTWEVDGVGQPTGQNNNLSFTFTTTGHHTVKLTVINSMNQSFSSVLDVCVRQTENDICP